jgi:hypothetical protein
MNKPKPTNPLRPAYEKARKKSDAHAEAFALKCKADAGEMADRDERTCFGIHFFDTEAKAWAYDIYIRHRGDTYNGGWFHGMACGRDFTFDYTPAVDSTLVEAKYRGVPLYAVSVS